MMRLSSPQPMATPIVIGGRGKYDGKIEISYHKPGLWWIHRKLGLFMWF